MTYSELIDRLESLAEDIELNHTASEIVDPYSNFIIELGEIYFEVTEADLQADRE